MQDYFTTFVVDKVGHEYYLSLILESPLPIAPDSAYVAKTFFKKKKLLTSICFFHSKYFHPNTFQFSFQKQNNTQTQNGKA